AGNGPCMRTAIIGGVFRNDPSQRKCLTEAQTKVTHRDPKALIAANAVTELAALLSTRSEPPTLGKVMFCLSYEVADVEWEGILARINEHHIAGSDLSCFLEAIGVEPGRGVSGYAYHTVPAVVFAGLLHHWDFRETVSAILDAGGDADTTGAIAGALCGAYGGEGSIPREWIEGVWEWPVTVAKIRNLGKALEEGKELRIRPRWSPLLFVRNLVFLIIVLGHGFGRVRVWIQK
ncbi:ADP-ribosylglycohydrolase family protein, partial [Haloferula sp.]|uniref:ADP-ribosylglycohydrolase family protein n=1 Tax=Haloferula sp. TaxID=2497595 RepID=UPI003C7127CB